MSTEQTVTTVPTGDGSFPEWAGWIAALFGLWVLVSPFVLAGEIAAGTPFFSNVVAGILVAALGAYGGVAARTIDVDDKAGWASWLAALAGVWILVSPFVLAGEIATGTPFFSNVVAGILVAVLAGIAAFLIRTG